MQVDVLKVPHHGSANNLDDDFFERVIADHYVFSGNGEHGNPERESLKCCWRRAARTQDYTIHLTYPIEDIDVERKKDWEKEQGKEKKRKEKNPAVKVRKRLVGRRQWPHGIFQVHHDKLGKEGSDRGCGKAAPHRFARPGEILASAGRGARFRPPIEPGAGSPHAGRHACGLTLAPLRVPPIVRADFDPTNPCVGARAFR